MIAVLLVGLLASACAAPGWRHRHHSSLSPFDGSLERYLNQQMFDTNRFWEEFNRDLNHEMMQVDNMLAEFTKHFPRVAVTEGVVGNEYKITIPLMGYEEKDIIVQARKGTVMIQANHIDENMNRNSYLDVRSLPVCVGEEGTWSYENGVLKISFLLNQNGDSGTKLTPVTASPLPNRSREETEEPTNESNQNADIDIGRGDLNPTKTKELETNEIPKVEATTYAVDLKGDVEFVPVPY